MCRNPKLVTVEDYMYEKAENVVPLRAYLVAGWWVRSQRLCNNLFSGIFALIVRVLIARR